MVGIWLAGWLVPDRLAPGTHLLLEVVCVLVAALVGTALGGRVGAALGYLLARLHLRLPDRLAGAVARGGLALLVCWLLAGVVLAVGPADAAPAIRGSTVFHEVSAALGRSDLPRPDLSRLGRLDGVPTPPKLPGLG